MKNVLQFLDQLAKNNHKEWFTANKDQYTEAIDTYKSLITEVEKGLGVKDGLESAKVMRIYRDVRFSKDKTPYKNSFGGGFTRATKRRRGGYYLHIQPGASFIGGGFWDPEANDLKRIREEFAMDGTTIKKYTEDPTFKAYFGQITGESLKKAPKGFDPDNPNIELIRMKQYLITRPLTDAEVMASDFPQKVIDTFVAMIPFFDYMSDVLTTNLNGESILD